MKIIKITSIVIASLILICIMIEANPFAKKSDINNPSFIEVKLHIVMSELLMRSFYRSYFNSIPIKGNEKILDFGCGWGTEAKLIAKRMQAEGELSCLDISPAWIDATKKRLDNFRNVKYLTGDITKLEIAENTFDVIIIHFVWHDIDEIYRNEIMKSLAKILKPGGKIYIREPLMADRNVSFESIRYFMKINNLKEVSLTGGSSFWMGKMAEGVYEK